MYPLCAEVCNLQSAGPHTLSRSRSRATTVYCAADEENNSEVGSPCEGMRVIVCDCVCM